MVCTLNCQVMSLLSRPSTFTKLLGSWPNCRNWIPPRWMMPTPLPASPAPPWPSCSEPVARIHVAEAVICHLPVMRLNKARLAAWMSESKSGGLVIRKLRSSGSLWSW